jgi:hypothetical protein
VSGEVGLKNSPVEKLGFSFGMGSEGQRTQTMTFVPTVPATAQATVPGKETAPSKETAQAAPTASTQSQAVSLEELEAADKGVHRHTDEAYAPRTENEKGERQK